jgi:hypothetical protein
VKQRRVSRGGFALYVDAARGLPEEQAG